MSRTYFKKVFRDISETSQKYLSQVFVMFQKFPTKMVSCDFRRVTKIFDKIDAGSLETLKKWNVFWEQCIAINQVCHEHRWVDVCVRVLASQRSSKLNSKCIICYLFIFLTDKTSYKVVANAPVPVTADMNIKVPVNVKLQRKRHTCYSYTYFDTSDVSNYSFFM